MKRDYQLEDIIKRHGEPVYRFKPQRQPDDEFDEIPTEIAIFDMKKEPQGRVMICATYGNQWHVNSGGRYAVRELLCKNGIIDGIISESDCPVEIMYEEIESEKQRGITITKAYDERTAVCPQCGSEVTDNNYYNKYCSKVCYTKRQTER